MAGTLLKFLPPTETTIVFFGISAPFLLRLTAIATASPGGASCRQMVSLLQYRAASSGFGKVCWLAVLPVHLENGTGLL
jgi:hypothetical protein